MKNCQRTIMILLVKATTRCPLFSDFHKQNSILLCSSFEDTSPWVLHHETSVFQSDDFCMSLETRQNYSTDHTSNNESYSSSQIPDTNFFESKQAKVKSSLSSLPTERSAMKNDSNN